jgi:uncharacterized membrane protein
MMDMMDGMGGMMGGMMLLGLLLLAVVIAVAVYLGVRAAHRRGSKEMTAHETLQHRLAAGEITPEEYYERESLLRDSKAPRRL